MNFNEIFKKDGTYDNVKSHKKTGFHPLSRKLILGKATSGSSPSFLELNCQTSEWLLVKTGVPQGTTLDSLFFLQLSLIVSQMIQYLLLNCLQMIHKRIPLFVMLRFQRTN